MTYQVRRINHPACNFLLMRPPRSNAIHIKRRCYALQSHRRAPRGGRPEPAALQGTTVSNPTETWAFCVSSKVITAPLSGMVGLGIPPIFGRGNHERQSVGQSKSVPYIV